MPKIGLQIKKILDADPYTYQVSLLFSDGSKGKVDLGSIFDSPKGLAIDVIKGNLFTSCFIEAGALAWPNGLELCPDMLHMQFEKNPGNAKKTSRNPSKRKGNAA